MAKNVGLWIDHRKAVIVTITGTGEEIKTMESGMEKHVRFSGGATEGGNEEDVRDRKFGNHLEDYYDRVIASIHDAAEIEIFGPGEAKGELQKRLKDKGFRGQILATETTDKMTDNQIAAKVRQRFSSTNS